MANQFDYNSDIIEQLIQEQKNLKYTITGMHRGVVLDNQDPLKIGRLKIFVPIVNKKLATNDNKDDDRVRPIDEYKWCPYVSPFGGTHNAGAFFVPDVDSIVVCGFFEGNPDAMFWMGAVSDPELHNPPAANIGSSKTQYPRNRVLRTPKGSMIELDDSDGYERIEITTPNGNVFSMEDYRDNAIKVKAKGDILLDAGGSIFLNASGGVNVNANLDVNIASGNNVNVHSPVGVNLERDLNVQGEIVSQTGGITLVNGDVDVNGDVFASGSMLASGSTSPHHQHLVIAEAIDVSPDGTEIIDRRLIRANHEHYHLDMHIVESHVHEVRANHQHVTGNADALSATTSCPQPEGVGINVVNADNVDQNEPEMNNEFVADLRVTGRDCHTYDDARKPKPQTRGDKNSSNDNMNKETDGDRGIGKTGKVDIGQVDQQYAKKANTPSQLDGNDRSLAVIVEQVDRDYHKLNPELETAWVAMAHAHSVRGIAI